MTKPYLVCHMMMSLDGRIDCAMTAKLRGIDEYYSTLDALDVPTRISGRMTAELELALPGKFEAPEGAAAIGREAFSKKIDASGYEVVIDTHGTLLWKKTEENETPRLILTSESVSRAYLAYLDDLGISWIACGKESVDLARARNPRLGIRREAGRGRGRRTHQQGLSRSGPHRRSEHSDRPRD